MQDMLVKLYDLPRMDTADARVAEHGVAIRRAAAPEKAKIVAWIGEKFGRVWASEADVAFSRQPVTCFIATRQGEILGFACHEATCRNFFGPTAVAKNARGLGIGQALLLRALWDQRQMGYGYSVIGGVGPAAFYEKTVGAQLIQGSSPGIFEDLMLD